jgi:hypothetical protein
MSSTASPVIPAVVTSSNPGQAAMEAAAARRDFQHNLVQVSRGKVGGGGGGKSGNKKNKKSKKYNRKSAMKKRFSKKFRRSILRRKSRKLNSRKKNKKVLYGGDNLTIPSFSQTSPGGTAIINTLAQNHAQTLANSAYDSQVKQPTKPISA